MYCVTNFKSKKALKDAIKEGKAVRIYSNGPFPAPTDGHTTLEGPHYPAPHSWYAQAVVKDGLVIKIS